MDIERQPRGLTEVACWRWRSRRLKGNIERTGSGVQGLAKVQLASLPVVCLILAFVPLRGAGFRWRMGIARFGREIGGMISQSV